MQKIEDALRLLYGDAHLEDRRRTAELKPKIPFASHRSNRKGGRGYQKGGRPKQGEGVHYADAEVYHMGEDQEEDCGSPHRGADWDDAGAQLEEWYNEDNAVEDESNSEDM